MLACRHKEVGRVECNLLQCILLLARLDVEAIYRLNLVVVEENLKSLISELADRPGKIRIREGRAVINESRCIDCGECIRTCPQKAKKAVCNKLEAMDGFKWKIALPAPALYGQFQNLDDVNIVLNGLLEVGFADIILPVMGVSLPWTEEVSYFASFVLYGLFQMLLYYL